MATRGSSMPASFPTQGEPAILPLLAPAWPAQWWPRHRESGRPWASLSSLCLFPTTEFTPESVRPRRAFDPGVQR